MAKSRRSRAGHNGFGYDPIFFYPPLGRTLGEVPERSRPRLSHRGAAFRALRAVFDRQAFQPSAHPARPTGHEHHWSLPLPC